MKLPLRKVDVMNSYDAYVRVAGKEESTTLEVEQNLSEGYKFIVDAEGELVAIVPDKQYKDWDHAQTLLSFSIGPRKIIRTGTETMMNTDNVVDFNSKRPPVRYSIHVDHYYTGEIKMNFEGITSSPTREDKESLLAALKEAVSLMEYDIENHKGE